MKRTTANFVIFALVLLVAVALINLVHNLQALAFGEVVIVVGGGTFLGGLGVNPTLLALGVGLAGLGLFVVALLWVRPRVRGFPSEMLLPIVLAVLFFLTVVLLIQSVEGPIQVEGGQNETGSGQGPPNENPGGLFNLFERALPNAPGSFILLVSFLALGAIYILMVVLRGRRALSVSQAIQQSQALKQEMRGVLEERIYALGRGGDVRDAILGAYRDMVNLFHSFGLRTATHQTAREVEALALEALELSGGSTADLRRLFEEARYSVHALGDKDRAAALQSLSRVQEELGA